LIFGKLLEVSSSEVRQGMPTRGRLIFSSWGALGFMGR
jgi:hypothetical protein